MFLDGEMNLLLNLGGYRVAGLSNGMVKSRVSSLVAQVLATRARVRLVSG